MDLFHALARHRGGLSHTWEKVFPAYAFSRTIHDKKTLNNYNFQSDRQTVCDFLQAFEDFLSRYL